MLKQRSSPLDSLKQQYAAEVVKGDADDKLLKCLEHGIRVPKGVAEPKVSAELKFTKGFTLQSFKQAS